MTYHERRAVVSIASSILITGIYYFYVYQRYLAGGLESVNDLTFWAAVIVTFVPISVAAQIVIAIAFSIIHRFATREEEPSFQDERDKLIDLKAGRNTLYAFVTGFFLSIGSILVGFPEFMMFVFFVLFGMLSSIVGDVSKIVMYRRGV